VIVLDAAALVDVVLDQPSKPWVLDRLRGQPICAPAHQRAELLSALARLVRAGAIDAATATAALAEATGLKQEHVVPTGGHLRRALELHDRVRVLDGLYVALAEEREATLVTTDARLAGAPLDIRVHAPG
jgi:predicted nucleic acid-binding protein